ncbi:hypothetical protein O3M35_004472 [Rhynocoris fuscipes]|uniref:Uncharacterized protein n=1 Tax=Rhynocoris fuscipes TaxID=488301 RepID=A0AAW1CIB4_9HEMI
MVEKKKIISIMNLKHPNNKVVSKAANDIINSLRKDKSLESFMLTMRRLIRGLGGETLRYGCFSMLKWLISSLPGNIPFHFYERLMKKVLSPSQDASHEKGDVAMAQLLLYAILINADYVKSVTSEVKLAIASRIMELASKKSYLIYPAYRYLSVLYSKHEMETIPDEIMYNLKNINSNSLDKLHFILNLPPTLQETAINIVFNSRNGSIFDKKVMKKFVIFALNEPINNFDHPFYNRFINVITTSTELDNVSILWKILSKLIKKKEIKDKKLFLSFLTLLIRNIKNPDYIINFIVSKELIEIISATAKCREMKLFLNDLENLIPKDRNDLRLEMVNKFIFKFKFINIEEHSATNFISHILTKLSVEQIKPLAKKFWNFLTNDVNESNTLTFREKSTIFRYYSSLINSAEVKFDCKWRLQRLTCVVDAGIFIGIVQNINSELADMMRNAFFNAIGAIQPTMQEYRELLGLLLGHILERLQQNHAFRIVCSEQQLAEFTMKADWIIKKMRSNEDQIISARMCAEVTALFILINFFRQPEGYLKAFKDVEKIFTKIDADDWTESLLPIVVMLIHENFSYTRAFSTSIFKHTLKYFNKETFSALAQLFYPKDSTMEIESEESTSESDSDDELTPNKKIKLNSSKTESDSDQLSTSEYQPSEFEEQSEQEVIFQSPADMEMMDVDVDVDEMDEREKQRLNLILQEASRKRKHEKRKIRESKFTHMNIRLLDLLIITCKHPVHVPLHFWLTVIPDIYKRFRNVGNITSDASLHCKLRAILKNMSTISFRQHYKIACIEEANKLILIVNILLEDVTQDLPKTDKMIVLNLSKNLLNQTNIYYNNSKQDKFLPITRKLDQVLQIYLKRFFLDRTIIPVNFFMSLCESKWDGMKKLINDVGNYIFYSDVKFNRRLLGFKILNAFFINEYYFTNGDLNFDDLLKSYSQMHKDSVLFTNSDCLEKFVPLVKNFLTILSKTNATEFFDINQMNEQLENLVLAANEYKSKN